MNRAGLFLALLLLGSAAAAQPGTILVGRVVAITDGAVLTALVAKRQVKVRLADIDAPEATLPLGSRSRQSLAAICFNKVARLHVHGKDRYGRTIATVYCAGIDANAEQVSRGMAWVFDRYGRPDTSLHALQEEARAAARGLWSDPEAVPQ
jgi:endonuclease YncB( thermonuclease family)